jgi:SPP1 gp7 family putative phage head morphogenesis protein
MDRKRTLALIQSLDTTLAALEAPTVERLQRIYLAAGQRLEEELTRSRNLSATLSELALSNRQRQVIILDQVKTLQNFLTTRDREAIESSLNQTITAAYSSSAEYGVDMLGVAGLNAVVAASVPVEAITLVARDASARLFRHTEDFATNAANAVGVGLAMGSSMQGIARSIQTLAGSTAAQARAIAQTEVINASVGAALATYAAADVDMWALVATADTKTCKWCLGRNGLIYRLGDSAPPLHVGCRCFTLPVLDIDDVAWLRDFREAAIAKSLVKPTLVATYWETKSGAGSPTPIHTWA